MNVACADNIEIFPEKALPVKDRLDKFLNNFIFDVNDSEQEFNNVAFFSSLFLGHHDFLILILDFIPGGLYFNGKVFLSYAKELIHLV